MDKNPAECVHDYFHSTTHYSKERSGYDWTEFKRLDVYYCRLCLEQKQVEQHETTRGEIPIWWQH